HRPGSRFGTWRSYRPCSAVAEPYNELRPRRSLSRRGRVCICRGIHMKRWLPLVAGLGLALTAAAADPPAPAVPIPVDQTLARLEQVGKTLREFTGKLTLVETDVDLQTSTKKTGQIWFRKTPNGEARVHVVFDMRFAGGL